MTRVLVVDDEPRIVSFVARALTAEGFRVDGAQDGLRGLDLARTGRYELVVLDLLLPGPGRGDGASAPDRRASAAARAGAARRCRT